MGHSMGGFNALLLSLGYPEKFMKCMLISPFVPYISPFDNRAWENFARKAGILFLPKVVIKSSLVRAFVTEDHWQRYLPENMIRKISNRDDLHYSISNAEYDLPGFTEAIERFTGLLEDNGIPHIHCTNPDGDHESFCQGLVTVFLDTINRQ